MKHILAWVKLLAGMFISLYLAGIVFWRLWPLILQLEPMLDRVALVVLGLLALIALERSVWPGMWEKLNELMR